MKNAHERLLLIRSDGGSNVGFGHVMRSMAIAEEWLARGGRCVWATTLPRSLNAASLGCDDIKIVAIDAEAGGLEDARATLRMAEECSADWVLADLFTFSPAYFSSAGSRGARWMIVHDEPLHVNERIHVILNPGPQATPELYTGREEKCALLLGLDYALIRSEIRLCGVEREPRSNPPQRILITFGGSDPDDLTWSTLIALSGKFPPSSVRWRVILGPGYRGECLVRGDFENLAVEFVRSTSNMAAHYVWADLVICGASTTLWEAFYFGLPAVVIPAAPNQKMVYEALEGFFTVTRFAEPDAGLAPWMRTMLDGDSSARDWLATAALDAPKLVDGRGAVRVVEYLLSGK